MSSKTIEFLVPDYCDNTSLKTFLKRECNVSSRIIAQLKREKDGILRDDKIIRTVDTVKKGDIIKLNLPDETNGVKPVKGDLNILFEDEYVIVYDKPFGIPVHPTKIYQTDTLANYDAYKQTLSFEKYKFRPVNRLDKDTSGLVIVAKDKYTASFIQNHTDKTYYAVCEGIIEKEGIIDKPIKIKEGHTIQRVCADDGLKSVTRYRPVSRTLNHTFLEIKLETGHTHQIRVHFSYIGHPLAGDDMYGGSLDFIKRQALHCGETVFFHPIKKEYIKVKSELPEDIKKLTV